MGSTFYSKRLPNRKNSKRRARQRPKTFKTEEKAKEYAEKNNISDYNITRLSDHKYRIDKE